MKLGLVKNQKQAEYVMILIIFFSLLLGIYFARQVFFPNLFQPSLSKEEVQKRTQMIYNKSGVTNYTNDK